VEVYMAVEVAHWRFTATDYHRMAEVGILTGDDHVELIDGEIVRMSPIGRKHVACVTRADALLQRRLGGKAIVFVQNPVALSEHTEPEPDLAVLKPRDDFYERGLPTPDDVLAIIEVADSSLDYDRSVKLPIYARAGIAEAWLVDIEGQAIERHTEPIEGSYRLVTRVGRGKGIESTTVLGLVLQVDAILG